MSARFWFLLLMGAGTALAQRLPDNFDEQRAEQEGRELTAELLSQVPAGNYTNTGVLEIYQRGSNRTVEMPVRFTVRVHGDRWTSLYEALSGETNMSLTSFTILSAAGRPNRFYRGNRAILSKPPRSRPEKWRHCDSPDPISGSATWGWSFSAGLSSVC